MKVNPTEISGAFEITMPSSEDERGDFVKILHKDAFVEHGLETEFVESYYSTSVRGVIRGMHFQLPPHAHNKLVYAVEGSVMDVLLDLRKDSKTFKKFIALELSKGNRKSVYIPKGVAHGFEVISESATLVYMTTTVYSKESDAGVLWNSIGYEWNNSGPNISTRDKSFVSMDDFDSPF
ncbi:MAG: dTDP-4-dehydrorhamnose 3,5-epimerase [Bacteroidetes bacterium]|nr:MAG: dTDP-4-dehydrorhamnose 3,5-epimerase [Bacteroidota bacterium]